MPSILFPNTAQKQVRKVRVPMGTVSALVTLHQISIFQGISGSVNDVLEDPCLGGNMMNPI